jgi:hypothetical protein
MERLLTSLVVLVVFVGTFAFLANYLLPIFAQVGGIF